MSRWIDLAAWRPTTHHGGEMHEVRGLVLHIAEGFYEGTIAWQRGDNAGAHRQKNCGDGCCGAPAFRSWRT